MARRRAGDNLAGIAAQFLGLLTVSLHRVLTKPTRSQAQALNRVGVNKAALIPPILSQIPANPSRDVHSSAKHSGRTHQPKAPASTTELLDQLQEIDWFQFEKIVALTYRKQGYSVARRGGASPDGGIDLVIEKNGQCRAVQCKHWKAWKVGVKGVREFLGALTDGGFKEGIFITLRGYTEEARQLAVKHHIQVVDRAELAAMLAHLSQVEG